MLNDRDKTIYIYYIYKYVYVYIIIIFYYKVVCNVQSKRLKTRPVPSRDRSCLTASLAREGIKNQSVSRP